MEETHTRSYNPQAFVRRVRYHQLASITLAGTYALVILVVLTASTVVSWPALDAKIAVIR